MQKTIKISTIQLFCLLMLSRLLSILTLVYIEKNQPKPTDYLLGVAWAALLLIAFSIPAFIFIKKYPHCDIIDVVFQKSHYISKSLSILYALFFSYVSLQTLLTLKLFVEISAFQNEESILFIVAFIFAAFYASSLGLEAIGRAGTITFTIFICSFLFVILIMSNKVEWYHFSPFLENGLFVSFQFGMQLSCITYEIAMLYFFPPKTNGKLYKMYLIWLPICLLSMFSILFFTFGGLGDYAAKQIFPVYSIVVLSEIGVFQRFDVLLTGIWILTAFLKISLLFYLQSHIVQKSFSEKFKNQYTLFFSLLLFAVQAFLQNKFKNYILVTNPYFRIILFTIFTVVIPSIVLITDASRKRKKEKLAQKNL